MAELLPMCVLSINLYTSDKLCNWSREASLAHIEISMDKHEKRKRKEAA